MMHEHWKKDDLQRMKGWSAGMHMDVAVQILSGLVDPLYSESVEGEVPWPAYALADTDDPFRPHDAGPFLGAITHALVGIGMALAEGNTEAGPRSRAAVVSGPDVGTLVGIVREALPWAYRSEPFPKNVADAVVAAGWRPPTEPTASYGVTCRHCGHVGPRDEDHSCPCPYSDETCYQHPEPTAEPSSEVAQGARIER